MVKMKYAFISEYGKPNYWNNRTPMSLGVPKLVNLYLNLNDNKLRAFLKMQNGKVLDLGCGDGRFLAYADLGVDFSLGMLKRAKKEGKRLVRASISHLPFKDKSFDVAFMVDVSLHIKPTERKEVFKEARRVAKNVYDFLAEHRTFFPFLMSAIRGQFLPDRIIAYLVLLFCFPIDRIRKLMILQRDFARS